MLTLTKKDNKSTT